MERVVEKQSLRKKSDPYLISCQLLTTDEGMGWVRGYENQKDHAVEETGDDHAVDQLRLGGLRADGNRAEEDPDRDTAERVHP